MPQVSEHALDFRRVEIACFVDIGDGLGALAFASPYLALALDVAVRLRLLHLRSQVSPSLGLTGTWTVLDRMHSRHRWAIDIYMGVGRWGRRSVTVRWTAKE